MSRAAARIPLVQLTLRRAGAEKPVDTKPAYRNNSLRLRLCMPQALLVSTQGYRAMSGNVLDLTDANFQSEVLASDQPVLVDFWAPWCGPCKMIAPTVNAVAEEFLGKARVGKLNTDDNPKTATAYNISAIPALLVFKGGQVVDRFVGVVNKDKLATSLNRQLG